MMGAAALIAVVMISIKWTDGGRYFGWRPLSPAATHDIQCAVVRRDSRIFASLRQDGVMPLTFSDDDWAVFVRGTPLP